MFWERISCANSDDSTHITFASYQSSTLSGHADHRKWRDWWRVWKRVALHNTRGEKHSQKRVQSQSKKGTRIWCKIKNCATWCTKWALCKVPREKDRQWRRDVRWVKLHKKRRRYLDLLQELCWVLAYLCVQKWFEWMGMSSSSKAEATMRWILRSNTFHVWLERVEIWQVVSCFKTASKHSSIWSYRFSPTVHLRLILPCHVTSLRQSSIAKVGLAVAKDH